MSSFFTLPASQRKRKRERPQSGNVQKSSPSSRRKIQEEDENISGSDDSGDDEDAFHTARSRSASEDSEEDDEFEDPASKRIRLAEQYLANTQREVLETSTGFDAVEIDQENLRSRMGERLKADTAESKGKIFKWVGENYMWRAEDLVRATFKTDGKSVSGVAVDLKGEFAYTCSLGGAVTKWALPSTSVFASQDGARAERPHPRKPKKVAFTRYNPKSDKETSKGDAQHHTGRILCIAVSPDGRFVATGGSDKKLIIWDASSLAHLKTFYQHRDSVTSLSFRRGTNQLFSASKDRTIKIWSLDELAYIETLFGHQDEVVDISALSQEKCISVGARDRTARLWKVVEESQLVFRGGGADRKGKQDRGLDSLSLDEKTYHEGSTDRVAMLDDDTFVTASDNGSLSLWNIHKKKSVFTYPRAHGLDPPLPATFLTAETDLGLAQDDEPKPRWVTALRAIPFSDTFITGSWDGYVRAWKVSPDKRRIEAIGPITRASNSLENFGSTQVVTNDLLAAAGIVLPDGASTTQEATSRADRISGIVNDLAIVERGKRGDDGLLIVAAVGKSHRLGRWTSITDGWNGCVMFHVPLKSSETTEAELAPSGIDNDQVADAAFEGFD